MTYDAAIFDLDGTLADTLHDIVAAMDHVLRERSLPTHTLAAYRGFIGEGARRLAERALPQDAQDRVDEVLHAFRERYLSHLVVHTRIYPGVLQVLSDLAASRVPISVLSNKPHEMTVGVVERLLPDTPFVAVLGQRPDYPRKPDPTVALSLCDDMGVAKERCAMVGDSRFDMQTAAAAGMVAVGVLWGFAGEQELRDAGAHEVIATPQELLTLRRFD